MEVYHDCWNADCPNLAIASCLGSTSCCEKSPAVPGGTPPGKLAILLQRFLLSRQRQKKRRSPNPEFPPNPETRKTVEIQNLQILEGVTLVKKWTHRRRKLAVRSAASCGGWQSHRLHTKSTILAMHHEHMDCLHRCHFTTSLEDETFTKSWENQRKLLLRWWIRVNWYITFRLSGNFRRGEPLRDGMEQSYVIHQWYMLDYTHVNQRTMPFNKDNLPLFPLTDH